MSSFPSLKARSLHVPVPHVFRALESRNFRLFISGQLISLVGTWMQQMAMSWLVYRLTGSAFLLGLVAFLGQGPGLFIAPFAGMLADRHNRRKILIGTQTLAMAQAFALAYLTLSGHIAIWQILYLGMFLGIVNGVDIPVRQAFVSDMLDKPENLGNAISLNASVFNGARLVGPALAGLAVATVGEGWCFFINAFSYIAVVIALLSMRISPKPPKEHPGYLHSLREGFGYAWRFTPIRATLMLVALFSLVGLPYSVLVPVFTHKVLHGGPAVLGYLMGSAGAGALTGAIYLASRRQAAVLGRIIPLAASLFGLGLIAFSFSHTLWTSMGIMYGLGLAMMLQLASCNISLQTLADEDKRGRVMSLYAMSFMGMTPFGSLLLGSLASHVGLSTTLLLGGSTCILAALVFGLLRERLCRAILLASPKEGSMPDAATTGSATQSREPAIPVTRP